MKDKETEKTKKHSKTPNSVSHYLDWALIGESGWFRYLIGVVIAFIIFFSLSGILAYPIALIFPDYDKSLIGTNIFNISAFIAPFLLLPLMVKFLHKRPTWSIGFPKFRIEKWNLGIGFMLPTVASLIALTISNLFGVIDLKYVGFDWSLWIPLLLVGVVGLFIQVTSEEFIYRGYFAQVVRRFTKNPYIIILVTAYLFASPHMSNLGDKGFLGLMPYLINGTLFGWVAYKTKSLWMSIGLHWSNNFSILLIAGSSNDVLKPAAPLQYELPSVLALTISVAGQAIFIALVLRHLINKRNNTHVMESAND